jgi:hypothetical protein
MLQGILTDFSIAVQTDRHELEQKLVQLLEELRVPMASVRDLASMGCQIEIETPCPINKSSVIEVCLQVPEAG